MPDVVYDPQGTAGDVVGIPFTPNTGAAVTGQSTHQFSLPRDGGFDKLEVFFTEFDPGETFTFRVDIDPTSVKGSAQPGPSHAASVSGLELSGATVTVHFADGGESTGQLFALEEGAAFDKVHSEILINENALPAAPSLTVLGVGQSPAIVSAAPQTIRISGTAGSTIRLLQTETALHLAGVPNGGFDIDAFEANKVVFVRDDVATIGAGGFIDVPVTLRDSLSEGGLNYFTAVVDLPDGRTSNISNVIKLALNGLPPGSAGLQASATLLAEPAVDSQAAFTAADSLTFTTINVDLNNLWSASKSTAPSSRLTGFLEGMQTDFYPLDTTATALVDGHFSELASFTRIFGLANLVSGQIAAEDVPSEDIDEYGLCALDLAFSTLF
jgi:hypothetical protein